MSRHTTRRAPRRRRLPVTALFAIGAVALAACSSAPEPDVEVTLAEYAIGVPEQLPTGPTVLSVRNEGHAHHNLSICPTETGAECSGPPVEHDMLRRPEEARDPTFFDDRSDSLTIGKRWVALVEVDLEPGTYRFFCGIIGHAARGMERTVVVEG